MYSMANERRTSRSRAVYTTRGCQKWPPREEHLQLHRDSASIASRLIVHIVHIYMLQMIVIRRFSLTTHQPNNISYLYNTTEDGTWGSANEIVWLPLLEEESSSSCHSGSFRGMIGHHADLREVVTFDVHTPDCYLLYCFVSQSSKGARKAQSVREFRATSFF